MTNAPSAPIRMASWPVRACLATGVIRHERTAPRRHAFAYPAFHLMLPLRHLSTHTADWEQSGLAKGSVQFRPQDHGNGRAASLAQLQNWLDSMLHRHGILDATGECWLQCLPTTAGYSFKPVSFWYCLDASGDLAAVVAEVNNTFGQRHCYLLHRPQWGQTYQAHKVFHVSPFCQVQGGYDFRFMSSLRGATPHIAVRVDHWTSTDERINTSMSGQLLPATPDALRRMFWRYPLQSWTTTLRIHWHALRLWLKGVPVHSLPPNTPPEVTLVATRPSTP